MEVVGSEIGQKMRSAIKAKLTELGCYVDDELPDYVMVMVANKRTRSQMEEDLQLFLGDNTTVFVNWLHQVLKKLQEVTITPPAEPEKVQEKEKSKEKKAKKVKDKVKTKDKRKKIDIRKAKKKDKDKSHKKSAKKTHKSKKKCKKQEMIRPNIPPLLMNIEKVSEPSITDVFAGQILKNHGITIDMPKHIEFHVDIKPIIKEKRPILPIIDPATILCQPEEPITTEVTELQTNPAPVETENTDDINMLENVPTPAPAVPTIAAPREGQLKEMNEIEAKIQGLKQKLAEQLDSMSEDEDFINIRTEAEELMNDFAEDVFQEISAQAPEEPVEPTPLPVPIELESIPEEPIEIPVDSPVEIPKELPKQTPEELPETIELNLPKRPVRERLGAREEAARLLERTKLPERKKLTPERFTPEPDPDFWGKANPSAKSRLGAHQERKRITVSTDSDKVDERRNWRRTSPPERHREPRSKCASVVIVKPRMRPQASSLLLRAVADAHKSLLTTTKSFVPVTLSKSKGDERLCRLSNEDMDRFMLGLQIPPKMEAEPQMVKRALVRPMRRCLDNQKIVIQVPQDDGDDNTDIIISRETEKEKEYVPVPLSRKFANTDYVPSTRKRRQSDEADDAVDTINIHNTAVDKDKRTQFIVTMDGFNANALLAKKLSLLEQEGLLDDDDEPAKPQTKVTKTATEAKHKKAIAKDKIVPEKHDKIITKVNKEISVKDKANETVENEKVINKTEEVEVPANEVISNTKNNLDSPQKDRLSDSSEDSDTQVIIKHDELFKESLEKRRTELTSDLSKDGLEKRGTELSTDSVKPPEKKRKASPIVFDVGKKEREKQREREDDREREMEKERERKRQRTESAGSDLVTVTTAVTTKKYDTVPPLLSGGDRTSTWCRAFPSCRYGASCAFQHPRCKFAASCTRRNCPYSHDPAARPMASTVVPPALASHVVPVANYKSLTPGVLPSVCRFYPNCANAACRFYHPKPCKYGTACLNKIECNFYHNDGKFSYA